MQRYPTKMQALTLVSHLNRRFGLFQIPAEEWLAAAMYKDWDNSAQSYFLRAAWPPMSEERAAEVKASGRMTEEFWAALTPKGRHVRVKGLDEFFAAVHHSWDRVRWRAEAKRVLREGEVAPGRKLLVFAPPPCAHHDNWKGREMTIEQYLALPMPDCTLFACCCVFQPPK